MAVLPTMAQYGTGSNDIMRCAFELIRSAKAVLVDGPDCRQPNQMTFFSEKFSNALLRFVVGQNILWPLLEAERRHAAPENGNGANCVPDPVLDTLRGQIEMSAADIAEQLKSVVSATASFCQPVLLKGACFIAEADFRSQPWRNMDDLDLLVEPSHVPDAVKSVRSLGYESVTDRYHVDIDVHFPILMHPSRPVGVEIHTRCMRWPVKGLLDNETLLSNASPVDSPYGRILLPNAEMRLIHLIANAQIKDNCHRRRIFRLRDAIDFAVLCEKNGADLQAVESRFANTGRRDEFLTFVHTCERVFQQSWLAPDAYKKRHSQWTGSAIEGLLHPAKLKRFLVLDWMILAASILLNPVRWKTVYWTLTVNEKRSRHLNRIKKQFQSLR